MGRPKKSTAPVKRKRKTASTISTVKGMRDLLPEDYEYFDYVIKTMEEVVSNFAYRKISTPIVEKTDLFARGVGKDTDIVQKEMFTFVDKGKVSLTMRPDGTSPVVRSYIEHGMISQAQPVKLFYVGPMFRRENPQKGRYRQFWQFGIECLGNKIPLFDAEAIYLGNKILEKIGIKDLVVKVNSIGCVECRKEYLNQLKGYYVDKRKRLCDDCKRRYRSNPLRLLDCKKTVCKNIASEAPQIVDFLCEDCHKHFRDVLEYLDELEVRYELDSSIVRGLDYYNRTVVEFFSEDGDIALGGGGRYDDLALFIGNKKEIPAVGWAMGLDRIAELVKEKDLLPKKSEDKGVDIFFIQLGEMARKKSIKILDELIEKGYSVSSALQKNSIKAQLRAANKSKAKVSLILGQKEALEGSILIRDMENSTQEVTTMDKLMSEIDKRLK